jgi:hypothetical protein
MVPTAGLGPATSGLAGTALYHLSYVGACRLRKPTARTVIRAIGRLLGLVLRFFHVPPTFPCPRIRRRAHLVGLEPGHLAPVFIRERP